MAVIGLFHFEEKMKDLNGRALLNLVNSFFTMSFHLNSQGSNNFPNVIP